MSTVLKVTVPVKMTTVIFLYVFFFFFVNEYESEELRN